MALERFNLETLCELDGGKVVALFDRHLKRCADDCYDRPGDDKARKITLEVELMPVCEPDGTCTEVKAQVFAKYTIPVHRTKAYSLGLRPSGQLLINLDSPDHVDQTTLLDGEKKS